MAQQFLHVPQGSPLLQQMGGEAVAQGVGGDFLVQAGFLAVGFQDVPDPLAGQALAAVIDKEGRLVLVVAHQGHPGAGQVLLQAAHSLGVGVHDPLLGAFAPAADVGFLEVDVLDIEGNQFADPQAGGVQEFQDVGVAAAFGGAGLAGGVEEQFDLRLGEVLGQGAADPGGAEGFGGRLLDVAVLGQIGKEGLDGGHLAGGGGVAVALAPPQVGDVVVEQLQVHPPPGVLPVAVAVEAAAHELLKLAQVVAVGVQGVAGQALFHDQVLQETLYNLFHKPIPRYRYPPHRK